jgi:hypothetical protein
MSSDSKVTIRLLPGMITDEPLLFAGDQEDRLAERIEHAKDGLELYQRIGELLKEVARQGRKYSR